MSAEPRHPRPLTEEAQPAHGIAGVETSTAGFIGAYDDPSGATAGEVIECAGLADFQRAFGETASDGGAANLAGAVAGFFANGGRRCYAVRENDADAVAASALAKLALIDDIALVAAPGIVDAAVLSAIAAHCSEHLRFAIFDTPEDGPGDPDSRVGADLDRDPVERAAVVDAAATRLAHPVRRDHPDPRVDGTRPQGGVEPRPTDQHGVEAGEGVPVE